jgi:hypothetical protein
MLENNKVGSHSNEQQCLNVVSIMQCMQTCNCMGMLIHKPWTSCKMDLAGCLRFLQTTCNSLIRANHTPLMIWVSICYIARVGVSALQTIICFEISSQLLHQRVELMYKEKIFPFSLTTHEDKWILSSVEIVFVPWQSCHCQSNL